MPIVGKALTILLLALIGVVSIWTPFINEIYFQRWFQWPSAFFSSFVPLLLAICAYLVLTGFDKRQGSSALSGDARLVRSELHRPGDQLLSLHHSGSAHDTGGGSPARLLQFLWREQRSSCPQS